MKLTRTGLVLRPDPARVIFRPLHPGDPERVQKILSRVAGLTDPEVDAVLAGVLEEFSGRHKRLHDFFLTRFEFVRPVLTNAGLLSIERKLLIGAYFSQEYSLEAAALFNPSIIPHPDQSGLPEGHLRFVLSLRATGEGHLSSITFRSGQIGSDGGVLIDTPTTFVSSPEHMTTLPCEKVKFRKRLLEQGADEKITEAILAKLPEPFELKNLRREIDAFHRDHPPGLSGMDHATGRMLAIASAHYELVYTPGHPLSERVLFPTSPDEAAGIEDARFVRFENDDGSHTYFATYTAYDGRSIHPQLLETRDFLRFRVHMLSGSEIKNKGMALFPRKISGQFAMLSRQDGENLYLMTSEDLHSWSEKKLLLTPSFTWEYFQIGNCGSPIETDEGWLVLTHGVGPMRKYSIGALLLDKHDPSKIVGRLEKPLLSPDENEREGYVPNVVYSCGALIHSGFLILPYAMSDTASSFATIRVDKLLSEMKK